MARLIISAALEDYSAAPGNTNDLLFTFSVTTDAGVPVAGLTSANVTLGAHTVPAGGATSTITAFFNGPISGTYTMRLKPTVGNWLAGVYIYDFRVINGADQGTIVTSVLMD